MSKVTISQVLENTIIIVWLKTMIAFEENQWRMNEESEYLMGWDRFKWKTHKPVKVTRKGNFTNLRAPLSPSAVLPHHVGCIAKFHTVSTTCSLTFRLKWELMDFSVSLYNQLLGSAIRQINPMGQYEFNLLYILNPISFHILLQHSLYLVK